MTIYTAQNLASECRQLAAAIESMPYGAARLTGTVLTLTPEVPAGSVLRLLVRRDATVTTVRGEASVWRHVTVPLAGWTVTVRLRIAGGAR